MRDCKLIAKVSVTNNIEVRQSKIDRGNLALFANGKYKLNPLSVYMLLVD